MSRRWWRKPRVRYVSMTGNDKRSGRWRWRAKRTVNAAVTALGDAGGTVRIGPGTFNWPDLLPLPSNVALHRDGIFDTKIVD